MNATTAPAMPGITAGPANKPKGEPIGYADGKVVDATASTNGDGVNLKVEFPAPVGTVNVYVKGDRTMPPIGETATFVAILDPGELTPRIRLAGTITMGAVLEVFTRKA